MITDRQKLEKRRAELVIENMTANEWPDSWSIMALNMEEIRRLDSIIAACDREEKAKVTQ